MLVYMSHELLISNATMQYALQLNAHPAWSEEQQSTKTSHTQTNPPIKKTQILVTDSNHPRSAVGVFNLLTIDDLH